MPRGAVHKPTKATREAVASLIACGCTVKTVGQVVGIAPMTLRKWYASELSNGKNVANARISQALYRKALSGDVPACIFWLRNRSPEEWPNTTKQQITGADEGPVQIEQHMTAKERINARLDAISERLRNYYGDGDMIEHSGNGDDGKH